MRRRGTVSRKPSKAQQRKPTRPKRSDAAGAARPASSTFTDLQEQVGALTRELAEAREQQVATSEVLRVIASSPADLGACSKRSWPAEFFTPCAKRLLQHNRPLADIQVPGAVEGRPARVPGLGSRDKQAIDDTWLFLNWGESTGSAMRSSERSSPADERSSLPSL